MIAYLMKYSSNLQYSGDYKKWIYSTGIEIKNSLFCSKVWS